MPPQAMLVLKRQRYEAETDFASNQGCTRLLGQIKLVFADLPAPGKSLLRSFMIKENSKINTHKYITANKGFLIRKPN